MLIAENFLHDKLFSFNKKILFFGDPAAKMSKHLEKGQIYANFSCLI